MVQEPLPASQPDWWQEVLGESAESGSALDEAILVLETGTGSDDPDVPRWRQWVEQARTVVFDIGSEIVDRSPQPLRWVMAAAAAVGVMLGLFLGAAAPAFSAALLTALGGSLLLISSSWTVVTRVGWTAEWMPSSTPQWLAWWLIAAVIGLCVQWIFRARRADKSAS